MTLPMTLAVTVPTTAGRALSSAALLAALLGPAPGWAAGALDGTRAIVATTADGSRLRLGSVRFTPAPDGQKAVQRRKLAGR